MIISSVVDKRSKSAGFIYDVVVLFEVIRLQNLAERSHLAHEVHNFTPAKHHEMTVGGLCLILCTFTSFNTGK